MHTLRTAITIAWIVFWVYWLASAVRVKRTAASRRRLPLSSLTVVALIIVARFLHTGTLAVHSPLLAAIGAAVFASGLALAIWARLHLGSNWGMPMSQKAEPELVTTGPYHLIRHPIYTGLLAGLLGTALAINLIGLIVVAALGGYFYYCASIEERNLTANFPTTYPSYRAATKRLIPFIL